MRNHQPPKKLSESSTDITTNGLVFLFEIRQ